MKLLTLLFFFALVISKTFSQTVSVSITKTNVFYQWLDNPVTIVIEKCACEDVVVKATNGTLTGNGCKYIFNAGTNVSETIIKVGVKNSDTIKWLSENTYPVRPVPEIKEAIGTTNYIGKLSKNAILSNTHIMMACPDSNSFNCAQIISYSLFITGKGSLSFKAEHVLGNELPANALKFIKNHCSTGDVITFDNIKCVFKKQEMFLPPFVIRIAPPSALILN